MQHSAISGQLDENTLPRDVFRAIKAGNDDNVVEALVSLSIADRERCRKEVAKRLGVRVTVLDKMIAPKACPTGSDSAQGRAAIVEKLDPWHDAVDGAQLANEMQATVERFAVLPRGASKAIALWVLHSWAFEAFALSPILAFVAPTKRSGKSNALLVTAYMCPRGFLTTNPTAAAVFRLIERDQPTLIVDEVDKLIHRDSSAIDTFINGYIKRTATVIRCAGDDHEVREFSVWTPKAIALIGKPRPDTLHDRCIVIAMQPKLRHERVERRRDARLPDELLRLRQKALRWAQDNVGKLRGADPELPGELHDRAQDNWEPLLAISDLLGGDWPAKARKAALALSGSLDADTERLPVRLLDAMRADVLPNHPYDVIAGKEIEEQLLAESDSPWHEVTRGKPITAAKVARLLKPLGLAPKTHHDPRRCKSVRGYRVADFRAVFERYLGAPIDVQAPVSPCESVRVSETQAHQGKTADSKRQVVDPDLTLSKPEIARDTWRSDTLTLSQGGAREERAVSVDGDQF